jgi:hypothetical protein
LITIIKATTASTWLLNTALGAAGILGIFAAVGAAGYIFRDELSATVLFIINEVTAAVDTAITKLTNLGTQLSTTGSVLSAFAQNQAGFLTDEDYQDKLVKLGKEQNATIIDGNKALQERIELRDAELQRSLLALGKKGSVTSVAAASATGTTAQSPVAVAAEATKKLNDEIKNTDDSSNELLDTLKGIAAETDRFSNSAADAFGAFITGATDAKSAVRSIIQDLASLMSRQLITKPLGSAFSSILSGVMSGGSLLGGLGQSFGSLFSSSPVGPYQIPGFAKGGSMTIGGNGGIDKNLLSLNGNPMARVGRGETLSINPNNGSGSSESGVNFTQNVNISTGVQQTVRAELQRMLPALKRESTQGVQEAQARGMV